MWENETIVLITSLKKRLLAGKNSVRFSKISADTALPPFIKAIFQNQVEAFIQNETPIVIQATPHFDLSENDMAHIKDRFIQVFREAASFSNQEVEEVLRLALILRMDYLVKPVDTMRRLLFNGKTNIQFDKMNEKLSPFFKILPYAEKLIEECQRLSYDSIESDEYTNLMDEMLHRLTDKEPVKLAISDFSVLIDFVSETKGEDVTLIEGRVVQEFMADRNLWGFRRAVDVEMKLGKTDFNLVDLEMTLKRYLELKEEFSKSDESESGKTTRTEAKTEPLDEMTLQEEAEEVPEEIKEEADDEKEGINLDGLELEEVGDDSFDLDDIVSSESEAPVTEDVRIKPPESDKNKEDDTWDLDDVLSSDSLIEEETTISSQEAPEAPKPETKKGKSSEEEPVSKPKKQMRIIRRDQNQSNEMADDKMKDLDGPSMTAMTGLRQMIDEKTEKVFVKKLFGNDQEAYNHLMNKLEESESWRVAKILIDNELFKRDVDPFSREAIKLVDLVYSRYYPEEGVGGK